MIKRGLFEPPIDPLHSAAEILTRFPHHADWLDGLQERARRAGVHCVWGKRPPKSCSYGVQETAGQLSLLCASCEFRQESRLALAPAGGASATETAP